MIAWGFFLVLWFDRYINSLVGLDSNHNNGSKNGFPRWPMGGLQTVSTSYQRLLFHFPKKLLEPQKKVRRNASDSVGKPIYTSENRFIRRIASVFFFGLFWVILSMFGYFASNFFVFCLFVQALCFCVRVLLTFGFFLPNLWF